MERVIASVHLVVCCVDFEGIGCKCGNYEIVNGLMGIG